MKAAVANVRESTGTVPGLTTLVSELVKARLTALVLVTTLAGFFVGRTEASTWLGGLHVLIGTGLLAAGSAALNEWWERDLDGLMPRTAHRPLPAGLMDPAVAFVLGLLGVAAGVGYLAVVVNGITALLGVAAAVSYVLVYTPMKRRTPLNTLVGAVPGALPPLMGWTAARGELGWGGWALFGILFLWQIPHFMAIAWLYRDQYARAGFRMLPVIDPEGRATGWCTVVSTGLLLVLSLAPGWLGLSGRWYAAGALVLGVLFLWSAVRFTRLLDRREARLVFFASIVYLPLLLGLLMLDSALQTTG